MYCDPRAASAFIRRQLGEYQLAGISTMTLRQAGRIERLEVIAHGRKAEAVAMLAASSRFFGAPPHQSSGRMRVLNLASGEIQHNVRTPGTFDPDARGLEKPHD
jgi:hypothetical protein